MPTTLAFVSLFENGERDFVFNRGADEKLSLDDEVTSELCEDGTLHFGSATALLSGGLLKSYRAAANKDLSRLFGENIFKKV